MITEQQNQARDLLGSTVVSPYVGMATKQNGGFNASIRVQTLIFHLVVNSTRLKTVRSDREIAGLILLFR